VIDNRSIPDASVMPVLAYRDVTEAADWLCAAFGFRKRLVIGNHRIQLLHGNGALVVVELGEGAQGSDHSLLVRVEDADAHRDRAAAAGATIIGEPRDQPYGERQYTAVDPGGHRWTFSQSIADVDPASWGGELI
jgi:uncharacterized glyoxalase superfamily protein PhnB